jgi:quinol monooxygenase YgiN
VEWTIGPERADEWLSLVDDLTQATRDAEAGAPHVRSDHVTTAIGRMGDLDTGNPEIVHVDVPQDGWSEMGRVTPIGS